MRFEFREFPFPIPAHRMSIEPYNRGAVAIGKLPVEDRCALGGDRGDALFLSQFLGYGEKNLDCLGAVEGLRLLHVISESPIDASGLDRRSKLRGLFSGSTQLLSLEYSAIEHLEYLGIKGASLTERRLPTDLRFLDLRDADWSLVERISDLSRVEELWLSYSQLKDFHFLPRLKSLRFLKLEECEGAQDFGNVNLPKTLEFLSIDGGMMPESVDWASELTNLKVLLLRDVGPIYSIEPLASLGELRALSISGDSELVSRDLSPVVGTGTLRMIQMANLKECSHRPSTRWNWKNLHGLPLEFSKT